MPYMVSEAQTAINSSPQDLVLVCVFPLQQLLVVDLNLPQFCVVDDTIYCVLQSLDSELQINSHSQDRRIVCRLVQVELSICVERRDVHHKKVKTPEEVLLLRFGVESVTIYPDCESAMLKPRPDFEEPWKTFLLQEFVQQPVRPYFVIGFFKIKKGYGDNVSELLSCFSLMDQIRYLLNSISLPVEPKLIFLNALLFLHILFQLFLLEGFQQFCYVKLIELGLFSFRTGHYNRVFPACRDLLKLNKCVHQFK